MSTSLMSKALSAVCLAAVICAGGSAWAKPRIAVLGLEVIPGPTGAVDPEATQAARDITKELRQRVQSGASPYAIAPNSSKELTDEKLLLSCDNEAVTCMAVIGNGLSADMLLYGHIELKGDVYRVSLKLLDVKAKTVQPGSDEMPVGGSAAVISRRLYAKVIGDVPGPSGTLVIKARSQAGAAIDAGAVMIDEERKGSLAGGRLTVPGVAEGRHTVAIEAGGYRRFAETVTVRGGEQVSVIARLVEKEASSPTSPAEQSNLLWKVSAGGSAVVAAAGGVIAYYSYTRMNSQGAVMHAVVHSGSSGEAPTFGDCGNDRGTVLMAHHLDDFDQHAFERACSWNKWHYAGIAVSVVGGVGAIASLIMLSRDVGHAEQPATTARSKKPDVALVPMWMPDGGGASLSVRW